LRHLGISDLAARLAWNWHKTRETKPRNVHIGLLGINTKPLKERFQQ